MSKRMMCWSRPVAMAVVVLAVLTACQSTPWMGPDSALDRAAVTRLFVGNTVESFNLKTRLTSFTYYHPDGTALQERLWQRRQGRWEIRDDGQVCLAFGAQPMKCRPIVRAGGKYYKERSDAQGNRERIVRYRYFVAGNALDKRATAQ